MKICGIIAEYNPFHNGHQYHLQKSIEQSKADYSVIIMSGNFVQRGTPALTDKYIRTETALRCGADLVIELPSCYATGSAEFFAAEFGFDFLYSCGVGAPLCNVRIELLCTCCDVVYGQELVKAGGAIGCVGVKRNTARFFLLVQ